jgi:tripeptide aminopeptidase
MTYTSPLAQQLAPDLLERFLRYVQIDTQSRRDRESSPSTPGQLDLSRLLVSELKALGLGDAQLDENGYVFATLDGSNGADGPIVGLIAHVDTSPDAPGAGVHPVVHRGYDGGVIELPLDDTRLDPATMPELTGKAGHDIVTSSGDTLLGADDKAGVAAIMAAVAHLQAHPELPRPTLRIGFTPDEEIGMGASLFDLDRFGAQCAYTIDGSDLGELQDESFTAVEAIITVHGIEVHTGWATGKLINALRLAAHTGWATGKLINALRLAAQIVAALPSDRLTPETTRGREGFIHVFELGGTVGQARIRAILRDFDEGRLAAHVALLEQTVRDVMASEPRATVDIDVRRQYRNMRQFLDASPEVIAAAEEAIEAEGLAVIRRPIRGGTDGSLLSEMGLPTPNIFDGGHEYHSVREWVSVQDMAASAATLVRLAEVWARRSEGP